MKRNLISDIWIILAIAALTAVVWLDIQQTQRMVSILTDIKRLAIEQAEFFEHWEYVMRDGRNAEVGSKGVTNGEK